MAKKCLKKYRDESLQTLQVSPGETDGRVSGRGEGLGHRRVGQNGTGHIFAPLKWISMFVWRLCRNSAPKKKKKEKKKENSIPASLSASSKVTIHSVIIKCANGPQHGAGLSALCFLGHQMTGEKTVISSDTDSMIRIDSAKTGWSRQPMVAFSDAEPLSH